MCGGSDPGCLFSLVAGQFSIKPKICSLGSVATPAKLGWRLFSSCCIFDLVGDILLWPLCFIRMLRVLVLTHAHSHICWCCGRTPSLDLFPFQGLFSPCTFCCRCGGRLPGCFSPSPPTWRTLPPTPSLRSYFYRQPDHDFDDTEEAKRRRRELMRDLLTRMRLADRAYFDKNLTPRQDIFWRAHSHPSFSSSPEWWPVLWSWSEPGAREETHWRVSPSSSSVLCGLSSHTSMPCIGDTIYIHLYTPY